MGVVTPPRHILVVNDTQEILDLFREILEEEGYRVTLSTFTFRDLDDIITLQPDLIILDFLVGGEDYGWQLLQKVKMHRATASIPIIVCTAAVQLVRQLEGHLKEKGVGVVIKPFDIDDLIREVDVAWANVRSTSLDNDQPQYSPQTAAASARAN
jgi:CheY-like chemotaxis protein